MTRLFPDHKDIHRNILVHKLFPYDNSWMGITRLNKDEQNFKALTDTVKLSPEKLCQFTFSV